MIHLIYRNKPFDGPAKDYQFGVTAMNERWASGLNDIRATLRRPRWLALPEAEQPFITHDVHRRAAVTGSKAEARPYRGRR